jgi:membrane dipeptidase
MRGEMVRTLLAAGLCVAAGAFLAADVTADDISARAKKLHFASIVVDTHDYTTQRFMDGKFDLGPRSASGSIDIPRMREGNLSAIFFSIWMPSKVTGPEAVDKALDQIDAVREQVRKHSNYLVLATTAAEIREAHIQGKIA